MADPVHERRRTPRVQVAKRQELRLSRRVRVCIVDISASGVLLWAAEPLAVASAGRLQTLLGGVPFEAPAVITRAAPARDRSGHMMGAALTASPSHQRTLEGFLERAGETS